MANHEVVISGISGAFPETENVQELEEKIFSNESMITDDETKWDRGMNVPQQTGKMKKCFRFDQTFFGVHRRLCNVMDSHAKHSIEKSFEAICDAGINPSTVYGEKIAVLMSSMTSETEYGSVMVSKTSGHAMLGHSRCMQANRISYFFNFKGPSFALDSSWVGPMQALSIAQRLIAKGHVKAAVVGASNMLFNPEVSVHYNGLCKLSQDGKTRCFSADADGYARSEAVIVFFLQRAEDAIRSYGTLVKVACSTEMNHKAVFPDQCGFTSFLGDFYSDLPVKSSDIGYIEGDGTASLKLDAMELTSLSEVLCPGRNKPLLVSSIKSRLGHCESSSAFASIVHALIAMKTGYVPPVIDYSGPNPLVPALKDGRIKIVTEKTPLEGDYVGVTVIGLASIYGHVLLKKNPNSKPIKENEKYFPEDGIPRIFLLSGRSDVQMKAVFTKLESQQVCESYYALNHSLFRQKIAKHLFRGYSVAGERSTISSVIPYPGGARRPVWYVFSGMGSQWSEMGKGLMMIPVAKKAIDKCHETLLPKGINLIELITNPDPSIFDNILHAFVGIASIQIALVDLLEEIGITADGIVGHSVGELGCAYADKCMTASQVILAAYARGKASNDAQLIKGMMAAVGKGYKEIKGELPEGIEVACHNSSTSCTLSGPAQLMEDYVKLLKDQGVFARLVNVANIAYHSQNIAPAAPYLLKYLKEIIPEKTLRSSKWVSSSVPESNWDSDLAMYNSAEYHTNNLLSYVLFEEASAHIPDNAICLEIAPHGLLQAILKRSLPTCTNIPLTNRTKKEGGCIFLIEALGKMFTNGIDMDLRKLYPKLDIPLPRETGYLQPAITWDHSEVWIPLSLQVEVVPRNPIFSWKDIDLFAHSDECTVVSSNHKIVGNALYPNSRLLVYLMEFMSDKVKNSATFKCFQFQNIKFYNILNFMKGMDTKLQILYQGGNGQFETLFGRTVLITGQLEPMTASLPPMQSVREFLPPASKSLHISEKQIYDFFEEKDCTFKGAYRNISGVTLCDKGFVAKIKWTGSAEYFIDALLKLIIFYSSIEKDTLMEISRINELVYCPSAMPEEDVDVEVMYDANLSCLTGEGVKICFFKTRPFPASLNSKLEVGKQHFIPYSNIDYKDEFLQVCVQIVIENMAEEMPKIQLIGDPEGKICKEIVESKYFQNQNSKTNLRMRSSKDIDMISEIESALDTTGCYLVISETDLSDDLMTLLDLAKPSYLIQLETKAQEHKCKATFDKLSPILEQNYPGYKLVLYKKKRGSLHDANFVQTTGDYFLTMPQQLEEDGFQKTNFLISKYDTLADISNLLEKHSSFNEYKCTRYIFLDEAAPPFDPTSSYYKRQLLKDLKINICNKGVWGTLKGMPIPAAIFSTYQFQECNLSLNNVKCKDVEVKILGLNLQNMVTPSADQKFGVMEYSGVIGGNLVFGLAKLTEDNYLEIDPLLCWKKPVEWTMHQAATVPLFYCVAYYLLYLKSKYTNRPFFSLLVHGGHTAFAQAIINVAIGLNTQVYTTCVTEKQKKYILDTFPQLDKSNVYVIDGQYKHKFIDHILESTKGDGVKVVIDCQNDPHVRYISIQCTGNMGRYFLLCHSEMDTDFTFGMSVFIKETAVIGYNPELIFEMSDDDKKKVGELLQAGIKNHVVRPLDSLLVKGNCSRKQAFDIVISTSQQEPGKKVLMSVNKLRTYSQKAIETDTKEIMEMRNYLIIGSYNSLWYDLMQWLASKGANISIVLNQEEIPETIQRRLKNFIKKHKFINVQFLGMDHLNTPQSCELLIQNFQNGKTTDKVFFIKPGMEKELIMIDEALRKYSKKSWLVSIGSGTHCNVAERRRNDGFKAVSFVLKKNTLRNRVVVKVLDGWFNACHENDSVIMLDEEKLYEDVTLTDGELGILPRTTNDLLDLCADTAPRPCFVEISTQCAPLHLTKDVDPIFFFPGFQVSKIKSIANKLIYPTYLARYPIVIDTLDETASQFAKELSENFNMDMFTLVGEGWTGPLVLLVAKHLEIAGKISEVILMNASPNSVNNWAKDTTRGSNVISKYIPSNRDDDDISILDLKEWSVKLCDLISKESGSEFTKEDVLKAMDTMINRLECLETFPMDQFTIKSKVHLFSPDRVKIDISDLKKICEIPCSHHVLENVLSGSFLDSPTHVHDLANLTLLEYKMAARKQDVASIGTLDLILDAKFNTEGLSRV